MKIVKKSNEKQTAKTTLACQSCQLARLHWMQQSSKDLDLKVFESIVRFGRGLERQEIRNECVWLVWKQTKKDRIFEAVFSNSARALLWVVDQMTPSEFCDGSVQYDGLDRFFTAKNSKNEKYYVTLWGYDTKLQHCKTVAKLYEAIYGK